MIPKLLVGNNQIGIQKYIDQQISKFSISPFDVNVLGENNFSTKIEQIRDLKQKLELKPFQGVKKATIIYNAEGLTAEAQNASLKVLEEPPEDTVIILCTSNENLLLPTIISRCEIIRIKNLESRVKNKDIRAHPLEILAPHLRSSRVEAVRLGREGSMVPGRENPSDTSIVNIRQMDLGERFSLAEDLCKKQDKDEPLEVVRKRVEEWLDNLIKEIQSQNNLNNLKLALLAKKQIKQNLNIRLVLENFLINLL